MYIVNSFVDCVVAAANIVAIVAADAFISVMHKFRNRARTHIQIFITSFVLKANKLFRQNSVFISKIISLLCARARGRTLLLSFCFGQTARRGEVRWNLRRTEEYKLKWQMVWPIHTMKIRQTNGLANFSVGFFHRLMHAPLYHMQHKMCNISNLLAFHIYIFQ